MLVGIGSLIRIPQLSHSLNESYGFRQTQTAFVIRKYASDGIDLLQTPLPIFGRDSNVPLEFPLFQALGSLLVNTGLNPDMAARVLALLSFQAAGLILVLILLRWHGRKVAVVALALYEFLPFGLFWGAASLIDFFSVALALTMVYLLDRWFSGGSPLTLLGGSVAAALAFLVKPTTAPSWTLLLLASAAMVIHRVGLRAIWKRTIFGLAMGPGLGVIAAFVWTAYSDSIKRDHPLTAFLTSSNLRPWNFATSKQRADPDIYLQILKEIADHITGPRLLTLLVGIAAAIFLARPSQRLSTCGFLLVAISGPVIFLNLYLIHTYYLIAIYPALVTVMAVGFVWATQLLTRFRWQRIAIAASAVTAMYVAMLSSVGARGDIAGLVLERPLPAASIDVRANTPQDARIILIGCDWNPSILYFAQREGVMFREPTDPEKFWDLEPVTDYPFLLSCQGSMNPEQWLPPGYTAVAGGAQGLYRVVRKT